MVIKYCRHCDQRMSIQPHTGDHIHNCGDFPTGSWSAYDDVVVLGTWLNSDGTSGSKPPSEVMRQGVENNLFPSRAWVEGVNSQDRTARGNRKATHRQRNHLEYSELDDKNY